MGCDIHMYIEYRTDKNSEWTADRHHKIDNSGAMVPTDPEYVGSVFAAHRHYAMFAELASVRGVSSTGRSPQGLPKDMSEVVRAAAKYWEGSKHSESYLSLKEFKRIVLSVLRRTKLGSITDNADIFETDYSSDAGYRDIVGYCERLLDSLKVDNILLGRRHKPEVRLIFWFDS